MNNPDDTQVMFRPAESWAQEVSQITRELQRTRDLCRETETALRLAMADRERLKAKLLTIKKAFEEL